MQEILLSTLQKHWNYSSFRGNQQEIIEAVLQKKNVVALLPTGGGKSVCYQLPTLINDGVCLVVSPLIALMKDQVDALKNKDISAVMLGGNMSQNEQAEIFYQAKNNAYKFIYLSPEKLSSTRVLEELSNINIQLIAVDEAHCISQWGFDFRPSYLAIKNVKKYFPNINIIAVTASATKIVLNDIVEQLELKQYQIFKQSFSTKNLSYSVLYNENKIGKIVEIVNKINGCSIVYCKNRAETKQIAQLLKMNKIDANFYHAGLNMEERNLKQQQWTEGKIKVIVSTNAFGMGIDKADVRTVIHTYIPDCLESYYQEAGRAGRDGKLSFAVLLYNHTDIKELNESIAIKFPAISFIKEVYQSLANFLQMPIGIGKEQYFDFDLATFCVVFKYNPIIVINVLKILEQEKHLLFSDNFFVPSKMMFIANKISIESVVETHNQLDKSIKYLLRNYAGIMDKATAINEERIAKSLRISKTELEYQLNQLSSLNIIQYQPQKNTPQILFLENRADADYLNININAYLQRKKMFVERIKTIEKYINEKQVCRNIFIANYFDAEAETCQICDVCLSKKKIHILEKEFEDIKNFILQSIATTTVSIDFIFSKSSFHKKKFWQVFQFLIDQNIILVKENMVTKI